MTVESDPPHGGHVHREPNSKIPMKFCRKTRGRKTNMACVVSKYSVLKIFIFFSPQETYVKATLKLPLDVLHFLSVVLNFPRATGPEKEIRELTTKTKKDLCPTELRGETGSRSWKLVTRCPPTRQRKFGNNCHQIRNAWLVYSYLSKIHRFQEGPAILVVHQLSEQFLTHSKLGCQLRISPASKFFSLSS